MNDHQALLIISIMTEEWFRKIVFIFNLTGVEISNAVACSLLI